MPTRAEIQGIKEDFEYHLREATRNGWAPKCRGRSAEYQDYAVTPTADEAAALCEGCPLLLMCRQYAKATRREWGIWGGLVWEDGKVVGISKPFTEVQKILPLNLQQTA